MELNKNRVSALKLAELGSWFGLLMGREQIGATTCGPAGGELKADLQDTGQVKVGQDFLRPRSCLGLLLVSVSPGCCLLCRRFLGMM